MSQNNSEEINKEDLLKIMVATDIHLGYCEKDTVRGEDSFNTFEEILELAEEHDVDFILLGGDLFHDANPSQNSLHKCIRLLRSHTLGDKPIMLEFLSDQAVNFFDSLNQTVNYEDPNLNVSIPVFSIHGNHDDPSGFGRLSSLDILSTSGLINYFGKWIDLTHIDIKPILMKKGETQLALYGLSYISDARLARLFLESKVVMEMPDKETGEWFNIMVLHQNRADRGPKNYVPEDILPEFLDLVVWGHEHDCRIVPEENSRRKFYVVQPGSSVATSLAEGEALDKHCGILLVHKKQFKLEPLRLKSVRPFVFESINLTDYIEEYGLDEGDVSKKVMALVTEKIEELIKKADEKLTDDPRQPKLPLIRLRIVYTEEEQMFNAIRFGQQYNSRVANPMDMVSFKRFTRKQKLKTESLDKQALNDAFEQEKGDLDVKVEDIVDRYFAEIEDSKKLQVIPSKSLSELCKRLVDSNDDDAAERIVKFYKEKACSFLCENMPVEEDIDEELLKFRDLSNDTYDEMLKDLDRRGVKSVDKNDLDTFDVDDDIDFDIKPRETAKKAASARGSKQADTTTRGTTRGRGRGSRGGKKPAATKAELDISINKTGSRQSFLSRSAKASAITYEVSSGSD